MNKQRLFDLSVSALCLIALWPLAPFIWLLLFFLVGEPLVFKQKRVGKNGQIFTIYKLRSMYKNAEQTKSQHREDNEAPLPMFKISQDPRFIRKKIILPFWKKELRLHVGRFLSLSGIDELPQLWNILRGEMSLVGPRPLPVNEADALRQRDFAWWKWRHSVNPGIFSVWALDSEHNKSLAHWKRLEKRGLRLTISQQIKVVGSIVIRQLRYMTLR